MDTVLRIWMTILRDKTRNVRNLEYAAHQRCTYYGLLSGRETSSSKDNHRNTDRIDDRHHICSPSASRAHLTRSGMAMLPAF